jgi:DNA-binding beta-propeller fold protein YncE
MVTGLSSMERNPMTWRTTSGFCLLIVLLVASGRLHWTSALAQSTAAENLPAFEYDPTWPKRLPNQWVTGNIGAIAVDSTDHVWIAQRPGSTLGLSERYGLEGSGECCFPAPPIMEFDQAGNLVQAWGPIHGEKGELLGKQVWGPYPDVEWPLYEHGLFVDHNDNVWVNNQRSPSQVMKFTRAGKFLLRLGKEESTSSNDTMNFAGPAGLYVDAMANELYVSDGYRNRRIIVFDADTGAYKRHWGAFGRRPVDPAPGANRGSDPAARLQQFVTAHCVTMSRDRLVYVCDRGNNRIQVFQPDGTYVREMRVAPDTKGIGSVHALAFSADEDQRFLYVGDGANKKVWILRRDDLKILGSFGYGGKGGGQFMIVHALTVDSNGNVYVGETRDNNRVQRFKFVGMRPAAAE